MPTKKTRFARLQPAEEPVNQLCFPRCVWRHEQGAGAVKTLFVHTAQVRKLGETILAVAGADSAVAQTAKRQVVARNVDDAIVDARATGLDFREHFTDKRLALAENIQGQRSGSGIDKFFNFFECVVGQDGQYGTKNLFL